jgi:hypothetical protein
MTNKFWIAANIMFDLGTGKKTEVLLLVNNEIDATFFKEAEAHRYKDFVARRADNIEWFVEPTRLRGSGELFVIRGLQNV